MEEKKDLFETLISDEERNYLEIYKEDLNGLKDLELSEKEKALKAAKAGDEDAALKLVQDFLKEVVDISRLYAGQGIMLQDLIGEGNLALMDGVDRVKDCADIDDLNRFFSDLVMTAMETVVAARVKELTEEEKIIKKTARVAEAAKALSTELGRKVTVDELAERSKISKKQIIDALKNTADKIEGLEVQKN